jgi:hypothetical protein
MKIYQGIIISFLFSACANPVSPTGGNKDINPPAITNIKIDTISGTKHITIFFDEYIKTTNDIILNPQRKIEKKPVIKPSLKHIGFSIPPYTHSIDLTTSIRDLNENNLGKYPIIHLSDDTLKFSRLTNLNPYFKTQVKQFRLEKRIDTFYYRSYTVADTIYINGLPNNTNNLTAYLDANSNNTYDSTEWYSSTKLDSSEAVHLFPPIINKIEVDTSNSLTVAVIPFYFIGGSLLNDKEILFKNDTVVLQPETFKTWILQKKYPINYKKIPLRNYTIKETLINNKDTVIKYKPSLGRILNPTVSKADTTSEQTVLGGITFECDSILGNTNLIILQNGKYLHHISITLKTQSLTLPVGDYTIITYIDRNRSGLFDAHELSDSIIHYFDKVHVKPKIINVIKLYKPVQNTLPSGGKTNPLIPVSLTPKKGVEQSNITPE